MTLEIYREPVVEYIGHYGSDETHALSAWTSTSRTLTDEKRARIPQLLRMLAEGDKRHYVPGFNRHISPFEKSTFHFLVLCDKATHIHLIKHRVAVSINGESARYKELKEDRLYVPPEWSAEMAQEYIELAEKNFAFYHRAVEFLPGYLRSTANLDDKSAKKRAKESARFILPMAQCITQDVMFNFSSIMHFLNLRVDPTAQREVRIVGAKMMKIVAELPGAPFEHSLSAFDWADYARYRLFRDLNINDKKDEVKE